MNDNERNAFDEYTAQTLSGLNGLLTTNEMCRNSKALNKINRFKVWLLNTADTTNTNSNNNK